MPSGCSINEDRRIELLPGPEPELAQQESAPAGAMASQQGRSLVVGLSLPAGHEVTTKPPAAAAPVPASRGSSAGAAGTLLQAGEVPNPLEAAQAAWSSSQSLGSAPGQAGITRKERPVAKRTGCVSSALIAEEAESKVRRPCYISSHVLLLAFTHTTPGAVRAASHSDTRRHAPDLAAGMALKHAVLCSLGR